MPIFLCSRIDSQVEKHELARRKQTPSPKKTNTQMRTHLLVAFCLFFSFPFFSQTEIGGTINTYAKVVEIDACSSSLTLSSTPLFSVGDEVLLIQMQGAEISQSNSSSYGDVEDYGGAGLFERNEIADIVGTEVFLKYTLVNVYDASGSVQLVNIPSYPSATVTETLSAAPWNGDFGGVLIFRAVDTLILGADIDVSGQGFRGGEVNPQNSDCNFLTNADDYVYSINNWKGAPKGEGITAPIAGKEQGRGAQANGGGGGNDHNSGGGGGANLTDAGEGGKQSVGGLGCDGDYPGERGKALVNTPERIFLGGGGGAGHVDDVGAGSNGGNGGGIAIIIAGELIGNGHKVIANGKTPKDGAASGDGQGGGGAGGTLILNVGQITGGFSVEATGGNGGNANNPSNRCFGPGGGGGGGRLMTTAIVNSIAMNGGEPGINVNPSGECGDPSNSADAGQNGLLTAFEGIPFSTIEPQEVGVVEPPAPQVACEGSQVTFTFQLSGQNLQYQWQVDDGINGWQDVMPSGIVTGVYSHSLTYFSPETSMDGWLLRCFVTSDCAEDLLSPPVMLTVLPTQNADFNFNIMGGGTVQFNNISTAADSVLWDFGDTNFSTDENPAHTYTDFGEYTVTLTIFSDCGETTTSQTITVDTPPTAAFSSDVAMGCAPLAVQFFNESTENTEGFEWQFPGGVPATSFDENPSVVFPDVGTYDVTLIVLNSIGADTLTQMAVVQAEGPPDVGFITETDDLTVLFVNQTQNATGTFFWDFGDNNTSAEAGPEHTYEEEGIYEVTLTAENECGEATFSQTVSTGQFPSANFSSQSEGGCAPTLVTFSDLSTGSNLIGRQWEFEGGDPAFSLDANPQVNYAVAGTYDVKLTVFNTVGEHTLLLEEYVSINSAPGADFSFVVDGQTVSFTNNSTGADGYFWNFGDGEFSEGENPTHTYNGTGFFTVTLNASAQSCGSAVAQDVYILGPNAVDENGLEESIVLFPNPTDGRLNLRFSFLPSANAELKLVDVNGQILRSEKMNTAEHTTDLSNFPAGIYFLKITDRERTWVMRVVRS